MSNFAASYLKPHVGNLQQVASVRAITIEEGSSLGMRALAFSTGGGLDFWVLSDRCMDIGPLWLHGFPMAWIHPNGIPSPALNSRDSDDMTGIERCLSGFMVTCGFDNVRQPKGGIPLHGSATMTPARVRSYGEQWRGDTPFIYAEGEVVCAHLNRASFQLNRRIEAPICGRQLTIYDSIENTGTDSAELQILYHTNLGFPFVKDGLKVTIPPIEEPVLSIQPKTEKQFIKCYNMRSEGSEIVLMHSPSTQYSPEIKITVESQTETLPYMQIWSDQRPGRGIVAIEPTNCSRVSDGTSNKGTFLAPSERLVTSVTYRFESNIAG